MPFANDGSGSRSPMDIQAMNLVRKKKPLHYDTDTIDLLDQIWDRKDLHAPDQIDGLRACITLLPEKMRQIIELRYRKELASWAIADQMGVSINSIYIYVSKARRILKECIDRHTSTEDHSVTGTQ